MKKILLIVIFLLCLAVPVSAYGVYLSCPESVQAGVSLKCTVDSDFPPGTSFNLVLYQSGYTATQVNKMPITIQADHKTQNINYDTTGLPGGSYKAELQAVSEADESYRSDSKTMQLVTIIDRSGDIEITSPVTQDLADALRIEGSLKKGSNNGIEIEVNGPDGRIFGPQWIGTTKVVSNDAGKFTQKVTVKTGGEYTVDFSDANGYVGTKMFMVAAPTVATTAIPVTTVTAVRTKTTTVTTAPTPWPTTTAQSPLSPLPAICGLAGAGLIAFLIARRDQ